MKEKKEFKIQQFFILTGALFFMESCIPFIGGGGPSIEVIQASSDSNNKGNNSNRKITKKRRDLSSKYFAKSEGDSCGRNENCERLCINLYDDEYGAQEKCFDLKEEAAHNLDTIKDLLRDPEITELKNIDHEIFEIFLGLSLKPWVEALKNADREEAGIILAWIAVSKDIASAIVEYGSTGDYTNFRSYEGLKELLKAVAREGSTDCAQYKSGFEEHLNESGFSFCEIAVREGNTKVTNLSTEQGILGDFLRSGECGQCWDRVDISGGSCEIIPLSQISDSTVCDID